MWAYLKSFFVKKSPSLNETNNSISLSQTYVIVPPEFATTLTFSQLARQPSQTAPKEQKITIEKVYNEAKPQNPTKTQQLRRVGKIFSVLSDERKKDILDLIDPISTTIVKDPKLRLKLIEKRLNELNKRLREIEQGTGKDIETSF